MLPIDDTKRLADFLARLRACDEAAAEQFVAVYEPVILRIVRHRLSRLGLSGEIDAADILQQVLARFFTKVPQGLELTSSKDLLKLLVTLTNAQIVDARRHGSTGEQGTEHSHLEDSGASGHDPSHHLIEQEQLEQVHKLMSEEEWKLANARASGLTWDELALSFGKSAGALRRKLSRVLDNLRRHTSPE